MRTRENKCQISQNDILHIKFFKFQLCLKFDTYFLSARLKTSLFKTSYLKGGGGGIKNGMSPLKIRWRMRTVFKANLCTADKEFSSHSNSIWTIPKSP